MNQQWDLEFKEFDDILQAGPIEHHAFTGSEDVLTPRIVPGDHPELRPVLDVEDPIDRLLGECFVVDPLHADIPVRLDRLDLDDLFAVDWV